MRTKENKKGISLIVLIVTIIVVIILAAVVILTLSKNNPIESAKEARVKEDVRTFQDELALYISKQYTNAGGHWDGNISAKSYNEIVEYIPSFTKKYEGKFIINNNNLEYTNKLNDNEKEYAQSLNIKERIKLLPDEYQQVEYIESTGTQRIDTLFLPDSTSGFDTKVKYIDISKAQLCGSGWYNNARLNFGIVNTYSNDLAISVAYGNWYFTNIIDTDIHFLRIDPIEKKCSVDDVEFDIETTYQREGDKSFYLFARNRNGAIDYGCEMRLYYFKLFDNGNIVRNLIPCYSITTVTNAAGVQVPTNTKGLYDTVEGKFYTNQGDPNKGDFISGPDVD